MIFGAISKMYDIVFISYHEPDAEQNFDDLFSYYNQKGVFGADRVKRVKDVQGIHNAHVQAANLATTNYFFVVDGDAQITPNFNFDYYTTEKDIVHIWQSINPVNELVYGYGGVKLLPTMLTRKMDTTTVDMTTSISDTVKVMNEVSNITRFDTDPFSTWRSAFRECAKLASGTIKRHNKQETLARLETWMTEGDGEYGEYAIRGARAGMEFGISNSMDLALINNFKWLEDKFNE